MGDYLSRDQIVGFDTTDVETPDGKILVREIPADLLLKMAQGGAVETYEENGQTKSRVQMDRIDLIEVALRCIVDPETRSQMFKASDYDVVKNAGFGTVTTVATAALELSGWRVKKAGGEDADPNAQ